MNAITITTTITTITITTPITTTILLFALVGIVCFRGNCLFSAFEELFVFCFRGSS